MANNKAINAVLKDKPVNGNSARYNLSRREGKMNSGPLRVTTVTMLLLTGNPSVMKAIF